MEARKRRPGPKLRQQLTPSVGNAGLRADRTDPVPCDPVTGVSYWGQGLERFKLCRQCQVSNVWCLVEKQQCSFHPYARFEVQRARSRRRTSFSTDMVQYFRTTRPRRVGRITMPSMWVKQVVMGVQSFCDSGLRDKCLRQEITSSPEEKEALRCVFSRKHRDSGSAPNRTDKVKWPHKESA